MRQILITSGVTASIVLYLVFGGIEVAECRMKGGELVQGLLWFDCVKSVD